MTAEAVCRWSRRWLLAGILASLAALIGGCLRWEKLIFSTDREMRFPAGLPVSAIEEILFPATDGTLLYGWYLPGQPGQPLVLYLHGTATNLSRETDYLARLHNLGVTVFAFDYRGYGQSSGEPSEAGTYRDARGALAYLSSRGWEPARIVYCGRSLGAAVAVQLALEEPPAGLVLESPFTSLAALACHHHPLPCPLLRRTFAGFYDSLGKIAGLRSPLLIIQGDLDTIVPQQMAEELYRRAPEPKALCLVPGAGHADLWQVGGTTYWERWSRFLTQNAAVPSLPQSTPTARR